MDPFFLWCLDSEKELSSYFQAFPCRTAEPRNLKHTLLFLIKNEGFPSRSQDLKKTAKVSEEMLVLVNSS